MVIELMPIGFVSAAKPVMREFLPRGELRQPQWSHELMRDYWTRSSG